MKVTFGGGLNEWQTPHISEAYKGSYNFELSKDSYKLIPRPPFDLKGTATNSGDIRGFIQLVKRDNSETTLVQSGGKVYEWDGGSFTDRGSCSATSLLRDTYWSLGDYSVITDISKETVVSKWDGSSFSTLTTGLGTDLYAKYGIVHNGRVWLFNVTTSTDTPHLMVASEFEDPTSYNTTNRAVTSTFTSGLEAFYMLTPDLRPINGVAKTLAGDLIISTVEGALFKLSGSGPETYKWDEFYPGSQAVGDESMTSIGNDIVYMRKGGNIDSLVATQNYGDVAADDLSRWIPETVNDLSQSITVYDQKNQKVFFFVQNKVLVLFKDVLYSGALVDEDGNRLKVSPWSVYKTLDSSSFNTSSAKFMRRPGTTETTVFFGSADGRIFDLNGSSSSGDAGAEDIEVIRKTRLMGPKDGIRMGHITRGAVQYRRINEVSFSVELDWADEYNTSTASVTLKGPPASDVGVYYSGDIYYSGSFYYSQGFAFSDKISKQNFSLVGRGPGCFATFSTLDKKAYQVDNVEFM